MARRDPYSQETIRPERYILLAGFAALVFITSITIAFWPSATETIGDWEVGFLIGIATLVAFIGLSAVIVLGRYHAPKLGTVNRIYELTRPEIINLEPPPYSLPDNEPAPATGLPKEVQDELELSAKNIRPGMNELGQLIPWGAVRIGGWRLGKGETWESEGKDGFLLLVGADQMIEGYENRWLTCDIVLVRHDQVHPDTLAHLAKATRDSSNPFIPYRSPLYRTTPTSPEWTAFYRKNPEVRANVLDELGLYGLARELIEIIKRNGVEVSGPSGEAEFRALTGAMDKYLQRKGVSIEQARIGPATAASVWSLFRGAQSEASRLRVENMILGGQVVELRAQLRREDQRYINVYRGGGGSPMRNPPEITGQMESIPGYRMRDEGQ